MKSCILCDNVLAKIRGKITTAITFSAHFKHSLRRERRPEGEELLLVEINRKGLFLAFEIDAMDEILQPKNFCVLPI